MSPPKRRREHRRSHHVPAHTGRTVLWLGLLLVVALGGVWFAFGDRIRDRASGDGGGRTAAEAATGEGAVTNVLVREGLRRDEVARVFARAGIGERAYLAATGPSARGQRLAQTDRPTSLEGFLFPATYPVAEDATAAEVVDAQLAAYDFYTRNIDYRYARSRNLTRYDVLIIASMIEREASDPDERRLVAGVIYNRLRAGMRLDIDATTQYALGDWRVELSAADLATDSPYNTRRYGGLPPGPICNPGEDAIRAAARPTPTKYLYYVARGDGSDLHYFSRTEARFAQDVARARAASDAG